MKEVLKKVEAFKNYEVLEKEEAFKNCLNKKQNAILPPGW